MTTAGSAGGDAATQETLYRAFVGPNAAAYVSYFAARDAGGSWFSWHWPSTVCAFHWAIYRRRWICALAYAALAMAALVALVFHAAALANAGADQVAAFAWFWSGVAVAAVVIPPLLAKPLYYRAAKAAVAATAHVETGARRDAVARLGGTSRTALATAILLTGLLPIGLIMLGS